MIEYLGLDNRELDHDLVKCAKCGHEQYERPHPLNKGGKYAWNCDRCDTPNENGEVYLLTRVFEKLMKSNRERNLGNGIHLRYKRNDGRIDM